MPLPLQRMTQHGSKGIFVFDDQNLGRSEHLQPV